MTDSTADADGDSVRDWLVAACIAFTALLIVWMLLGLASSSGLARIDLAFVHALHDSADTRDPIGSRGFESIARDLTSLGSNTFLVLLVLFATTLLGVLQRTGAAALLATTTTTALLLNVLVKLFIGRPRPDFTSVTIMAETSSFPSSHAMLSCVVLLALAAIAGRESANRTAVGVLMASAIALTVVIGLTRIYLGAHWPSDVLAGWALGSAWVLLALKLSETPRPPE